MVSFCISTQHSHFIPFQGTVLCRLNVLLFQGLARTPTAQIEVKLVGQISWKRKHPKIGWILSWPHVSPAVTWAARIYLSGTSFFLTFPCGALKTYLWLCCVSILWLHSSKFAGLLLNPGARLTLSNFRVQSHFGTWTAGMVYQSRPGSNFVS